MERGGKTPPLREPPKGESGRGGKEDGNFYHPAYLLEKRWKRSEKKGLPPTSPQGEREGLKDGEGKKVTRQLGKTAYQREPRLLLGGEGLNAIGQRGGRKSQERGTR